MQIIKKVNRKICFAICFYICSVNIISGVFAQESSRAILLEPIFNSNRFVDSIYTIFFRSVIKNNTSYIVYDWNSKNHSLKINSQFIDKEKPVSEVIFIKPEIEFNLNPSLYIKQDTNKRTVGVFIPLKAIGAVRVKGIDVVHSTINKNSLLDFFIDEGKNLEVKYSKYFSKDPFLVQVSDPKEYERIQKIIIKDHLDAIEAHYTNVLSEAISNMKWFGGEFIASDNRIYDLNPMSDLTDNSIKRVELNYGAKDGLVLGRIYKAITSRLILDQTYYEELTNLRIDEVSQRSSVAKTLLFGSKDLASALKSNEKVILVPVDVPRALNVLTLPKNVKKINVAIKKDCLFCAENFENTINSCPSIVLVERNAPELKYFANLLKDEKFIDYSIENLQSQKLGYQILFSFDNLGEVSAIEVATNKNLTNVKYKKKMFDLSTTAGFGLDDISRIMSNYDSEIYSSKSVGILDEKKDRINELLISDPIGLVYYAKMEIAILVPEVIDGETINRVNRIGEGRVNKLYSTNLARLNIKEGEKELFKAIQNKEKIIIRYPIQ